MTLVATTLLPTPPESQIGILSRWPSNTMPIVSSANAAVM
jgi:hypothetical protein